MSEVGVHAASTRASEWRWPVVAGLAGIAACVPLISAVDFCLDDAWIHLAYARSLQLGDGFSYNPGDHATGFSSPLWALILAAVAHGSQPVVAVKAVGTLLHALTAALAAVLAWDLALVSRVGTDEEALRSARWAAAVAGVLTALLGHLVYSATSGMEVSLAAALVIATALASLRERRVAGFVLAFLGVLARPETLFFTCALGMLLHRKRRSVAGLAASAGALSSLLAWMLYCLAVSGYPWPNTMYVKGAADPVAGLSYLFIEVLLQQPWVLGFTGLAALVVGLWRGVDALRWLMAAWLATVLAISLTREVRVGGLFFYYRYYAIVAPLPAIALAVSLTAARRSWVRWVVLLPVAAVALMHWQQARELQRETEQDIAQLHSDPARVLARTLPSDAVLLVEGAGAMRYFMPRSVRVVDVVGLNHRELAHAESNLEYSCFLVEERPTHAAVPDEWLSTILPLFQTKPLGVFTDPAHHSGRRVFPRRLHLVQIAGANAEVEDTCRKLRAGS